MSLVTFILFGHICIAQPNDLDKCWNLYDSKIRYQSSKACLRAADQYIAGAKVYFHKRKVSITELEVYCFDSNTSAQLVLTNHPNIPYYYL
jgi:hypothetical protein